MNQLLVFLHYFQRVKFVAGNDKFRCRGVKAQLDGAWLGSFYVITDVTDEESYSNAPCILPGAFEYDSLSMT
jgi:hypothetical protein